jgi:hypothetical protein
VTVLEGRRHRPDPNRIASWLSEVSLSLAGPADGADLQRLADTDDRPLPPPPHLIARRDGVPWAALSLVTGEVVADPFHRTAELQDLLRAYAAGIRVHPSALAGEADTAPEQEPPRSRRTPSARIA